MSYTAIEDLLEAYEAGERPKLTFSPHALKRGVEMAQQLELDPTEIRRAMEDPDRVYVSPTYADSVNLARNRVCLAVRLNDQGEPVVATVLWATIRDWKRSYQNDAGIEGRERRFGAEK